MSAPRYQPLALGRRPEPFDHPEYLYEIKWDGFRTLVRLDGRCPLLSRDGNEFKSFSRLNEAIAFELNGHQLVLDGEIVALDREGKSQFYELMFHRGEPRLMLFDLLWADGEDLRFTPLGERKQKLRALLPPSERLSVTTSSTSEHRCLPWPASTISKAL